MSRGPGRIERAIRQLLDASFAGLFLAGRDACELTGEKFEMFSDQGEIGSRFIGLRNVRMFWSGMTHGAAERVTRALNRGGHIYPAWQ